MFGKIRIIMTNHYKLYALNLRKSQPMFFECYSNIFHKYLWYLSRKQSYQHNNQRIDCFQLVFVTVKGDGGINSIMQNFFIGITFFDYKRSLCGVRKLSIKRSNDLTNESNNIATFSSSSFNSMWLRKLIILRTINRSIDT